ncbi:DUF300-domain-containing protein [Heliocybe sulcata]|uniref:DUF300-domain-containing protein n=1 Tax=Heliocybe sulcata TaxID=5364 RepID=A0A5C3N0L8_9AGAM|nr:DUF300-domain-containing protein [Heliocybe sulcata]
MANITDGRCWKELAPDTSPPLFQQGDIAFQAVIASFWLINKHLQWYTNKREQRHIVRILFMVPLYAVISLASYLFWNHATPILLIRDCYESTVLTSFFYLLLIYISPNVEEQKEVFRKEGLSQQYDREALKRGEPGRKWVFPFGSVKWKPADGMYFMQLMKWGVLQYCVLRPLTTLIAVSLNYIGLYCEDSYSPGWGHIYITAIVSISVSVAMYCLLQLYVCVSTELSPYKPILKLFAVKAVVFLTFWQATALSGLSMLGWIKDTKYMTANDINNGIAAILETFEMMCFAFLHFKAFTYRPYKPEGPSRQRTPRLRSLGNAMDFRETFRELWAGTVYMWHRIRGKETDMLTRRAAIMEDIMGRSRFQAPAEKGVRVEVEETVHVAGERQWLGTGDDYGYGLGYIRREKSEPFEDQVERELQKRGYTYKNGWWPVLRFYVMADHDAPMEQGHERGKRSWWRRAYERVSQSGVDHDDALLSPPPRRRSRSRSRHRSKNSEARPLVTYDDPPPPSVIRTYRNSRNHRRASAGWEGTVPELVSPAVQPQSRKDSLLTPEGGQSERHSEAALAVPPSVNRSDSVLGRLFPANSRSDVSSVNTRTVGTPSTESYRPLEIRTPVVKAPREGLRGTGSLGPTPPRSTEGQIGETLHSNHSRSVYLHAQTPNSRAPPPEQTSITQFSSMVQSPARPGPLDGPPPSHRPRPDQIVLPAPLSPTQRASGRRWSAEYGAGDSRSSSPPDPRRARPLRRWSRGEGPLQSPPSRSRRTSAPPKSLPTIPQEDTVNGRRDLRSPRSPVTARMMQPQPVYPSRRSSRHDGYSPGGSPLSPQAPFNSSPVSHSFGDSPYPPHQPVGVHRYRS